MKKLKPLFGFGCKSDGEGLISIEVDCEFPQQRDNCLKLYNRLEELKIVESKIKTREIPSTPTAKFILKADIQELLCTYCIVVTDLSKPRAKNIEPIATKVVTTNTYFLIKSEFLLGKK